MMGDPLLHTFSLRKEFGGLVAVDDVDFTVPTGAVVSLIGPNGAGKTTFFNMLTGVYKPTAGSVVFAGEDLTGKPPHAFTERGIGRTFQNIRLFQNMTALENVLVGMHSRLKGTLVEAILRNQSTVLTVSSLIEEYYGIEDVYLCLPTVVGRSGVERVLRLELSPEEAAGLRRSAEVLKASRASLDA